MLPVTVVKYIHGRYQVYIMFSVVDHNSGQRPCNLYCRDGKFSATFKVAQKSINFPCYVSSSLCVNGEHLNDYVYSAYFYPKFAKLQVCIWSIFKNLPWVTAQTL